jgi:hypothetical protein
MAVVVAGSDVSISCGKQPTWITHRLGWVHDAFGLTLCRLTHHSPDHRSGLTFRLPLRRIIRSDRRISETKIRLFVSRQHAAAHA